MSILARGGALVKLPQDLDWAIATANIPLPGLVLAEDTSDAGQLVVAISWTLANVGDQTGADSKKRGIAAGTTLTREGVAQTGKVVTFIPLEGGALARVALYQSNDTITVGDALVVSATDDGYVDKMPAWDSDTATNYYLNLMNSFNLVGFATEAKSQNDGGTVLMRLARGFG